MLIKVKQGWEIPEREATPEDVYLNRREIVKALGVAPAIAAGASSAERIRLVMIRVLVWRGMGGLPF